MKDEIKYGFIAPVIEKDHYVFGSSPINLPVLRPDGQWVGSLPRIEEQRKNGVETCNCTGYGTNNCIEIILMFLLPNQVFDNSDRFTGIIAGTHPPGNDPHTVAEAIRNTGCIIENMLPFDESIKSVSDYFSFFGSNESNCRTAASLWKKRFEFYHEWVFQGDIPLEQKQALMKEALKYSPLGVSVYGWQQDGNGLYVKNIGQSDNHWTACVGYVEGEYWIIFDSYPDAAGGELKRLRWDFDFGFCKKYHVLPIENQRTISVRNPIAAIIEFIINLFKK